METFCEGKPPVTSGFPSQGPLGQHFADNIFKYILLNENYHVLLLVGSLGSSWQILFNESIESDNGLVPDMQQWALMLSLIFAQTNFWINSQVAHDLRHRSDHVTSLWWLAKDMPYLTC